MPRLHRSDGLLAHAQAVLQRERQRLAVITDAPLVLTGGSSLAGAWTVGDVDLHLRVEPSHFAEVVGRLREVYEVVYPEIWTDTLATFVMADEPVGIAVTPIGSVHDRRFTTAWSKLRDDPATLAAYNEVKLAHAGSDDAEYRAAKARFFDRLATFSRRSADP